ncbi:hypothetical protein EE612_053212, partial [Oryza sativa]
RGAADQWSALTRSRRGWRDAGALRALPPGRREEDDDAGPERTATRRGRKRRGDLSDARQG